MSSTTAAGPPTSDDGPGTAVPVCYRHPDRETYVSCQRCGRPICPDDMRPASVGFQCPECVREGAASVRQPRTVLGGRLSRRDGVVTMAIVALCVLVYVAELADPGLDSRLFLLGGQAVPGGGGLGVAGGEWWRLVTAGFLHGGIFHLAVNMLSLWWLGRPLETALGRVRFAGLYLFGLLAGSAAAYLLTPAYAPVVGASGAIFALLGALLVLARQMGIDPRSLVGVLVVNAAISVLAQGISWQAHAGGFVAGVVVGAGLLASARRREHWLGWAGYAVVAVLVVGTIVYRTGQLTLA